MAAIAPYKYDFINTYNGAQNPSTVHVSNTGLAAFFKRYLMQRLMSVFVWDVPEEWPRNYLNAAVFGFGCFAIVETDRFGVIPQICTLSGYDVFYQPSHALIAHPLVEVPEDPRIGRDCALVRLSPDYGGAWDLVDYYGDMMALTAETMGMNVTNSKLSYAFAASDKQGAESFKKLFDQVQSGNVAVFFDKKLFGPDGSRQWDSFLGDVGRNYIADKLQLLMEQMGDDFDAWVGIPNANVRKKAHVLEDELHANDQSTYTMADMWLETLREGLDQANAMFGMNLGIDWRVKPGEEMGGGEFE